MTGFNLIWFFLIIYSYIVLDGVLHCGSDMQAMLTQTPECWDFRSVCATMAGQVKFSVVLQLDFKKKKKFN